MIYLDNNATTLMPTSVKNEMVKWCNRGNPSSGYPAAKEARALMTSFRKYIGVLCGINTCCTEERDSPPQYAADPTAYKIIFTSGASEANCMLIHGVITSYRETKNSVPDVICGATEHKSIYEMIQDYTRRGIITSTFVNPRASGHIHPDDIRAAITSNTCLVCVMHANNETGAINDIKAIGEISHQHNIPFHCDTVQTFGKAPVNPLENSIDSFTISFHKLYGPPGVGALVVKQQLLFGYKIPPYIYGTQNEGYRGGTENLPGIGAAYLATKLSMDLRLEKNKILMTLRNYVMGELSKQFSCVTYTQYINRNPGEKSRECEIVFLTNSTRYYLPNTLLLSLVKHSGPRVCNSKLKADLEAYGVIISVGSACNTASPKASHVLYAMNADDNIRAGALRISFGDDNTFEHARQFIQAFLEVSACQIKKK